MSELDEDFFAGKRSWSIIKDQVLQNYMTPYIAKINKRGNLILLIDGYAGPGVFGDGTVGSPLIMCQVAEKYAQGNYRAIFINKDQKYHDKLRQEIRRAGWSGPVETILGDSTILLQKLPNQLSNWTVFLYLDPFGLKGCEFSLLKPFLDRNPAFSTEILLTMNMPIVHRLAARHVDEDRRHNDQKIKSYHDRLTKVFGGEYWKEIMWQPAGSPEEHERQLIVDEKKLISPTPRPTKRLNDDCVLYLP
jgi:three-Cys-motif partner protein